MSLFPERGFRVASGFDAVIIGSGPAGYKTAKLLLRRGWRVCLVERDVFGGVCLNAGCIPKDILYQMAVSLLRVRELTGERVSLRWEDAVSRAQEKVLQLRRLAEEHLRRLGLVLIYGEAELVDERVVKVEGRLLVGRYVVLACGSKPGGRGISPEDLVSGRVRPEGRVVVKGEDPSACELAFLLRVFGYEVRMEVRDRLLPYEEVPESFSAKLESALEDLGVEFGDARAGDLVVSTRQRVPNVCPQRFPFIRLRHDSFVDTDPYLETNVPGVYAVGDVVPPVGASYAYEKARVAVHNMLYGKSVRFEPSRVPFVTTSAYEVGFVGDLRRAVRFEQMSLSLNPKNFVNHPAGILRVGFDEEGLPVFMTAIGHGVPEVVNVFSSLTGGAFSHPSYAEIVEEVVRSPLAGGRV